MLSVPLGPKVTYRFALKNGDEEPSKPYYEIDDENGPEWLLLFARHFLNSQGRELLRLHAHHLGRCKARKSKLYAAHTQHVTLHLKLYKVGLLVGILSGVNQSEEAYLSRLPVVGHCFIYVGCTTWGRTN